MALAFTTNLAVVGLGQVAAALLVLVLSGRLPARTARGRAMLTRVRQLRGQLATGEVGRLGLSGLSGQAGQIGHAVPDAGFSEYLPYAIAFGLTRRWTRGFVRTARHAGGHGAASGSEGGDVYWYDAADDLDTAPDFGHTLDRFTATAAATGVVTWGTSGDSSGFSDGGFSSGGFSGGGFSGGGDCGGGGGSW